MSVFPSVKLTRDLAERKTFRESFREPVAEKKRKPLSKYLLPLPSPPDKTFVPSVFVWFSADDLLGCSGPVAFVGPSALSFRETP